MQRRGSCCNKFPQADACATFACCPSLAPPLSLSNLTQTAAAPKITAASVILFSQRGQCPTPRQVTNATGRFYPPSCVPILNLAEPVSSRSISRRNAEALSPATIRNVMSDLEEQGFLYQPHTSAGRVPTAAAYRFFAQQIVARATLSPEDEERIRGEFVGAGPRARKLQNAPGTSWRKSRKG